MAIIFSYYKFDFLFTLIHAILLLLLLFSVVIKLRFVLLLLLSGKYLAAEALLCNMFQVVFHSCIIVSDYNILLLFWCRKVK